MPVDAGMPEFDAPNEQFSAQEDWFAAHPECSEPTSDATDNHIRRILDVRQIIHYGPDGVWFSGTAEEFRDAVSAGMDSWWREFREELNA